MNRIVRNLVLLACAAIVQAAAQQATVRTYEFKNADANRALAVVGFVNNLLGSSAGVVSNAELKTAIIHGRIEADAIKAEELLKRYDVAPPPPPQVTFTAYLVRASSQPFRPEEVARPIPPELESAIAEMKSSFGYTSYGLVDTVTTEALGSAEVEGVLPGTATPTYFYALSYRNLGVGSDGKTVNIHPLMFTMKVPAISKYESVGITSDVAISEGQKLVFGKVKLYPTSPSDLFLVLMAKPKR